MTSTQVQSLVVLLPPDAPYFETMFNGERANTQRSLAKRLQIALTDPAVLAHIGQSYAARRLPLPQFPWPPAMIRSYQLFLDPKHADKNLAMAQRLQRPESHFERSIIRASLLCPGVTDEQIAEVFQLESEVVTLFELLWWNVRARTGDYLFLAQLLGGRHSVAQPEEEGESAEWALRLLRVGRATGNMHEILVEAGLVPPADEGMSEKRQLELILRKFLERVVAIQQKGQLSKRELALLEKYLADLEVEPHWADPFLLISQNKHYQEIIRQTAREQMMAKLQAQRLQWAKAEESKPAVDYEI